MGCDGNWYFCGGWSACQGWSPPIVDDCGVCDSDNSNNCDCEPEGPYCNCLGEIEEGYCDCFGNTVGCTGECDSSVIGCDGLCGSELVQDGNGDCCLAAFSNSFIHVLMYSHYFLSSLGVNAWWKKYLTQLQLIQFVICFIQPIYAYTQGASCNGYGDFLKVGMVLYQITMICLFTDFYRRSYSSKNARKTTAGKKEN